MSRINTMGGFASYASISASAKEEPEYVGSIMAFAQPSAPVGWTKQTAYNDYAIRIVNDDAITTGGSLGAASVFSTQVPFQPISGSWPMTVGITTISTTTMEIHSHPGSGPGAAAGVLKGGTTSPAPYYNSPYATSGSVSAATSSSTGTGGGHDHTAAVSQITLSSSLPLSIKYRDVLLAKY